ncbi:MAG: hypothetical protein N2645_19100, partial [Clostridia bacterium]|nr:hypothetical protein [Clostridia bacterium]
GIFIHRFSLVVQAFFLKIDVSHALFYQNYAFETRVFACFTVVKEALTNCTGYASNLCIQKFIERILYAVPLTISI